MATERPKNKMRAIKKETDEKLDRPVDTPGATLRSILHRYYLQEVAFGRELTAKTIYFPWAACSVEETEEKFKKLWMKESRAFYLLVDERDEPLEKKAGISGDEAWGERPSRGIPLSPRVGRVGEALCLRGDRFLRIGRGARGVASLGGGLAATSVSPCTTTASAATSPPSGAFFFEKPLPIPCVKKRK